MSRRTYTNRLRRVSRDHKVRTFPDEETLAREVAAWERERNGRGATVERRFTAQDAREKLERLYPSRS